MRVKKDMLFIVTMHTLTAAAPSEGQNSQSIRKPRKSDWNLLPSANKEDHVVYQGKKKSAEGEDRMGSSFLTRWLRHEPPSFLLASYLRVSRYSDDVSSPI